MSDASPPVKAIAFYLPQFHPIPENDMWWGPGFTEWSNVSKAVPQFVGHRQPKLPADLGFYDLRVVDVQKSQIELARKYGIHGFCFYYYWFDGKRLLETPIEQYLAHTELDFPFCICWANENWTRKWDGQEDDILIRQTNTLESQRRFIEAIEPLLRDPRYIRVDGRPLLLVYRASTLELPRQTAEDWRVLCRSRGLGDPFLVAAQTFGDADPREFGFDAAAEFPPHGLDVGEITPRLRLLNPAFCGRVYDYADVVASALESRDEPPYPLFRTVFPGWDNEPRMPGRGHVFAFSTPELYKKWLARACSRALEAVDVDKRIVFINAWNEWGEGAYLEPDRESGDSYLQATSAVLRSLPDSVPRPSQRRGPASKGSRSHDTAVILHLYYEDLWDEIAGYLRNLGGDFDLFVSVPFDDASRQQAILREYPDARVLRCRNEGRDMAPLLSVLPSLRTLGYSFACKIHTKKAPHREDGEVWRQDMLSKLLGSEAQIRSIKKALTRKNIGIVAPSGHVLPSEFYWGAGEQGEANRAAVLQLAEKVGLQDRIAEFPFVAGSMFWFKPEIFRRLALLDVPDGGFGPELGQTDGTLAHAFERFIGALVTAERLDVAAVDAAGRITVPTQDAPVLDYPYAMPTKDGVPYVTRAPGS